MEFLRPEGKHGEDANQFHFTRVRLAWYYRPSDVNDRAVNDSRLLLAAIYSEVTDVNHIRAKCHVVHRDKISDLSGWKKRPDRFYFNRLFDPYIKREFEIIPSTDARNCGPFQAIFASSWSHCHSQCQRTLGRTSFPSTNTS